MPRVDHAIRAARRRRERRLRQFLRHERLTVAVAFADLQHHTAGEEEDEQCCAPRRQHTPPPHQAANTVYFTMDDDEEVLAARCRPLALVEPRPQDRSQRRTIEQIVQFAPVVQMLDLRVPQIGERWISLLIWSR